MEDWSTVPVDLLHQLVGRLNYVDDFIRFSAVCKPWRSVALEKKQQQGSSISFAPWLMLTNDDHAITDDNDDALQSFFSPYQERFFGLRLPHAQKRRCWGSSYGWLVTIGFDLNIHLLHPLTGTQLPLPPQPILQAQSKTVPDLILYSGKPLEPERICRCFTEKFILASNPSLWDSWQSRCCSFVIAKFGVNNELAFATPGDETWTCIANTASSNDAVFLKGQIYCIRENGALSVCVINTTNPRAAIIAKPPNDVECADRYYLVEMCGDLHMVARIFDEPTFYYETSGFAVFKFDFHTKEWDFVEDLGNHALFLGNNTSFAMEISIYSDYKANCIYFTDDHNDLYYETDYCDMGVFDYITDDVKPFGVGDGQYSAFCRPLFFVPSL